MDIINETVQKIRTLQIQGATNIVNASLDALETWIRENEKASLEEIKLKAKILSIARPTEPFLQNVINSLVQTMKLKGIENASKVVGEMKRQLREINKKIINNGIKELKEKNIILTHCHSTSVEEILKKLHEQNPRLQVFATETRLLYQGRITVKHLTSAGVKVIMITDSEAAFMVSHEDKQKIEVVLFGADAILKDGSIINKVGSYGISLSAKNAKIPLYIVASLLKFTQKKIKIEEREPSELWQNPPEGVIIFNPAFDKVPKEHITGIITEIGTISPDKIIDKVNQFYPWISE